MTSKFPSTLVLMELAEELSYRHCELKLQWIRRDINQLADELTNEKFDSFDCPDRRRANGVSWVDVSKCVLAGAMSDCVLAGALNAPQPFGV